ncbi:MAG: LysR family transcriptional regulator [Polyangiales bacterium]
MDTDHVRSFYWTATLGSATAAANRLGWSQPTVTTHIQKLERQLGLQLFDHEPHRLSSAGERALPILLRVLEAEQQATAALASSTPVRFRLGVIESVLHSSLGGLVADLREHEANLQLEMAVHTSLELERLVEQGMLDLVVTASPASGTHVQTVAASSMEMVFVGNARLHTKVRYALAELAELGLVSFQAKSQPFRHLTKALQESTRGAAVHTASSISAMVTLVNAGFGVATLPRVAAERMGASELRILQCDEPLAPLPIHISYRIDPAEPRHRGLVERVIKFVRAR